MANRPSESPHALVDSIGGLHAEAESHVVALPLVARAAEAKLPRDVHDLFDIDGSAEEWRIKSGRDLRRQRHPDVQAAARMNPSDSGKIGEELVSREELLELERLRSPLCKVHGQWVHVTPEEIGIALDFWRRNVTGHATVREVIQMALGNYQTNAALAINHAPSLTAINDRTIPELVAWNYTNTATDADGGTFT